MPYASLGLPFFFARSRVRLDNERKSLLINKKERTEEYCEKFDVESVMRHRKMPSKKTIGMALFLFIGALIAMCYCCFRYCKNERKRTEKDTELIIQAGSGSGGVTTMESENTVNESQFNDPSEIDQSTQ